jgi:phage terminase large subunit
LASISTQSKEVPTKQQRPYQPFGAAEKLLYSKDHELILDGPAGTGKSRACLEKLHICAAKYPGMRGLIARRTRESLTESALVTYEDKVLPEGSAIKSGPKREQRHVYRYPNGSEVVVGGLDLTSKIMSTEYDLIYVQEAREVAEGDWEDLTTRLRNGVMPYQQIIGDTNPDVPTHWIKQRAARGALTLLPSRHEDNPAVSAEYLATLDALTGVRKKRLRYGLWVAADGQVYDNYDPAVHLLDRTAITGDRLAPIPPQWPRCIVVDFGFSNPFVAQWWALDHDWRLYRYREIYRTQRLVEDHAHHMRAMCAGEPRPWAVICDHDAEDRATLERHLSCRCPQASGPPLNMLTTAAFKDVRPGIQAVATRLRVLPDGKPRLMLLRDSLVERDRSLDERKMPACTEEEFESYIWSSGRKNPDANEVPLKKDDHGMDCTRYMVAALDLVPRTYAPAAVGGEREASRYVPR